MESICGSWFVVWKYVGFGLGGGGVRGQPCRNASANRELRESRMQTANAMVSRGRSARARIDWTRGTLAGVNEVEEGMRLVR